MSLSMIFNAGNTDAVFGWLLRSNTCLWLGLINATQKRKTTDRQRLPFFYPSILFVITNSIDTTYPPWEITT